MRAIAIVMGLAVLLCGCCIVIKVPERIIERPVIVEREVIKEVPQYPVLPFYEWQGQPWIATNFYRYPDGADTWTNTCNSNLLYYFICTNNSMLLNIEP